MHFGAALKAIVSRLYGVLDSEYSGRMRAPMRPVVHLGRRVITASYQRVYNSELAMGIIY